MRIQRYSAQRRHNLLAGCGCAGGIAVVVGTLIATAWVFIPLLPQIALQSSGFEPIGSTDSLFEPEAERAPSEPRPVIAVPATAVPPQLVISAGQFGERALDTSNPAYAVQLGSEAGSDQPLLEARITEQGLLDLCRQYSPYCTPDGDPARNLTFDLRPGGVIVRGEFRVPEVNIWQAAGVVMQLTQANRLEVVGVDMNGGLYAAPPNELGALVDEAEVLANQILAQLNVEAAGTTYRLDALYADDDALTLILR